MDDRWVDVSHEALIRGWPRLRQWIDEDRAGLRVHRRLTEAAQEWQRLNRDEGVLYRGARLAEALEWRERNEAALNELERDFLNASVELREREAADREAQRQHELEAAHRLAEEAAARERLRRRLGAGFLVLIPLGMFVSGFRQDRDQQRWTRESLGSLLLNIARTGALLVDGDLHQRVVKEGRNNTEAYESIQAKLQQIQEKNELVDPVYTLSDVRGKMARFAVITHGGEPVGKQYPLAREIQPILHRVLAEGRPAYTNIYTNQSGTYITAFAPIRNTAGQTVAALDVDFRADVYLEELAAVRRGFYRRSLAGAVLALVAGFFLVWYLPA